MTYLLEIEPGVCNIRQHVGWTGAFTRDQHAEAAYANGSRICKMREDGGDLTPLGTAGTVLGSIKAPNVPYCGYFIEWDDKPRCATFAVEWKIGLLGGYS